MGKSDIREKVAKFIDACRASDLKLTHQRLEIYRELVSSTDHPTAEILHRRLKKNMPTLSLDTVYRTLATFEEHALIFRVQTPESHARFEAELEPHHHAICSRCHRITDFQWDNCDIRELPQGVVHWGEIQDWQITLRGICAECTLNQEEG